MEHEFHRRCMKFSDFAFFLGPRVRYRAIPWVKRVRIAFTQTDTLADQQLLAIQFPPGPEPADFRQTLFSPDL